MCVLRLSQDVLNVAANCGEVCGIGKNPVSPNYLTGPCFAALGPLQSGIGALHQLRPQTAKED